MSSFVRSSLVAGACLTTLAFAAPARADINPLVFTAKDWTLVCDNVRRCEARALTPGANATLSVIRQGGPNQPISLRLATQGTLAREALHVDDAPSAVLAGLAWQSDASAKAGTTVWTLDGADAVRAIAELRNAYTLGLGEGTQHTRLSLAGLTATLLALEDHQGRLDTTTAIIREGVLDDNRAWPASPLPVVKAVPMVGTPPSAELMAAARESRRQDSRWECPNAPNAPRDLGFALTPTQTVIFLECERTPVGSHYVPLRTRTVVGAEPTIERLVMTMVGQARYLSMTGLPSPQVDAESGTLMVTEASDPDGQPDARCGFQARWRFDGEHFELTRYAEQNVCAGLPGDWPVWYRASVRD